ncbi:hypothetical protein EYF80_019313 [Liparis tanakae]|uniref:Uncharacterized protein n=1 Tax=Liparis tanakae TaxID=230148 RepID=A0A4Z2HX53_9TELE|nr:hypothetical protein EYF80_019313 [Liparis tanakae]
MSRFSDHGARVNVALERWRVAYKSSSLLHIATASLSRGDLESLQRNRLETIAELKGHVD